MEPSDILSRSPFLVHRTIDSEPDGIQTNEEIATKKKTQKFKQKMIEKEIIDSTVNESSKNMEDSADNIIEHQIIVNDSNGYGVTNVNDVVHDNPLEISLEDEKAFAENGICTDKTEANGLNKLNTKEFTTDNESIIVDGHSKEEAEEKKENEPKNDIHFAETENDANHSCQPEISNEEELQNENENIIESNRVSSSAVSVKNSLASEIFETSELQTDKSYEDTFYETVELGKEAQASPDTVTQTDFSLTNKLTNLLGKWQSSSPMRATKQDTEDKPFVPYSYLSKVTGRRGIKPQSNANDGKPETPNNRGLSLGDSFRVKTDPPRLNQTEKELEPVLRKYKAKRCLNVNDDDEEGDNENGYENGQEYYPTSTKRRKLEENSSGSGFLNNMLWSPFRKKTNNEVAAQSKLSRFLSPFWFWKKMVGDH